MRSIRIGIGTVRRSPSTSMERDTRGSHVIAEGRTAAPVARPCWFLRSPRRSSVVQLCLRFCLSSWVRGCAVHVAVLSLAGVPSPAPAQPAVRVIDGDVSCAECLIERHLVATLSDASLPGAIGRFAAILALKDGRFLFTRLGESTPYLADRNGAVIKQIGRDGAGPGEYRRPVHTAELADGFLVFDHDLKRMSSLSREFVFRSSANLPIGQIHTSPIVFRDGRFLISATIPTRESAGEPLHLVGPDGRLIRSFGSSSGTDPSLARTVHIARDSTIWVAYRRQYRLERWDTAGRLLAQYQRNPGWFSSSSYPDIVQVDEDDEGRLWVQINLFDDPARTVIEVLDLERLRVHAFARFDDWSSNVVFGGFDSYRYRETVVGEPHIDIWTFRFAPEPPQQVHTTIAVSRAGHDASAVTHRETISLRAAIATRADLHVELNASRSALQGSVRVRPCPAESYLLTSRSMPRSLLSG